MEKTNTIRTAMPNSEAWADKNASFEESYNHHAERTENQGDRDVNKEMREEKPAREVKVYSMRYHVEGVYENIALIGVGLCCDFV